MEAKIVQVTCPPTLAEDMQKLGIVIGNSRKNCEGYDEEGKRKSIKRLVICLPVDRFVVLDIDSQNGFNRFHSEFANKTLNRNIFAYVNTDKGVLLVCDAKYAGTVDYESDARYERISRERKSYDMHCLSKVSGFKRQMLLCTPHPTDEQTLLVNTWNTLASYAENLGPWREAIRQVDSDQ